MLKGDLENPLSAITWSQLQLALNCSTAWHCIYDAVHSLRGQRRYMLLYFSSTRSDVLTGRACEYRGHNKYVRQSLGNNVATAI